MNISFIGIIVVYMDSLILNEVKTIQFVKFKGFISNRQVLI